jgi:hypothetical protein
MDNEQEKLKQQHKLYANMKQFSQLVMNDLQSSGGYSGFSKKYNKEKIQKFLDTPEKYTKELRELSNILYNKSSHYKRLINYFAKMPLFSYIVEPYGVDLTSVDVDKFTNQYYKVLHLLDKMNLRHEFMKILTVAFREDIFYGYEFEEKESYYVQKLDPEMCKITTIEDGCFNFAFDMSYFDRHTEKLNSYPEEFNRKYATYKQTKEKWQELDSDNTICIKINEDSVTPIPPFSGVFEELFDIGEYKYLRKAKERMGIFKVLVQELPMRKDGEDINDFLIDFETMMNFHNKASESLPDEIGLITSPMPIKAIDIADKKTDHDSVAKTERDYWSATGVSQLLFHSEKSSSTGLNKSIQTDEEIIFGVLTQLERWLNRKVKKFLKSYKYFRVNMLNITIFNAKEVFDNSFKAAQYGLPTKMMAASALGINPSSLMNMAFLENDVLNLHEKFIPLKSSHTSNSNEEDSQVKDDDELSEEGVKTRDGNKNDNEENE